RNMSTALRQSGDAKPPRTSWWSAVVLLAGVIGIAGSMYYDELRKRPPEPATMPSWMPAGDFGGRDRTSRLLTPDEDDQPLEGEPADFAPVSDLPGVEAQRQAGFIRQ